MGPELFVFGYFGIGLGIFVFLLCRDLILGNDLIPKDHELYKMSHGDTVATVAVLALTGIISIFIWPVYLWCQLQKLSSR